MTSSRSRGSSPAARWKFVDGPGEIGIIATVSEAFVMHVTEFVLLQMGNSGTVYSLYRNMMFANYFEKMQEMKRSLSYSRMQLNRNGQGTRLGNLYLFDQVNQCPRSAVSSGGKRKFFAFRSRWSGPYGRH